MIANPFIETLFIEPLANHLWQSTLFAVAAGLLTFAFRKNRAQIRHGLWLTASLKFLVPFSLLMSLGGQLQWAPAAKTMATQAVSYTMVEITQPFPDSVRFAPAAPRGADWPPLVIFGVWACGFGVVTVMRLRDWLRIRAAVRASTPLEMPALAGAGVEVRSYPGLLEPGVVGLDLAGLFGFRWSRPILLLPAGIVDRLTRPQMEAIFAHELCHVRRRDNLTAAMHMVVETVFWFHPLVWWVGARLVEERERACDEEVLRQGGEPQVYAEAILNVCKFYVESPLACMSGVTGSDLKKRIERIMKERITAALSARKKLLLAAAGMAALVLPVAAGVLTAPRLGAQAPAGQSQAADANRLAFEVASVKRNKSVDTRGLMQPKPGGSLTVTNMQLKFLIENAYRLKPHQMIVVSEWNRLLSERFDIAAKAAGNPTNARMNLMLQSLLSDRFKLAVHHETRQLPVYVLAVSKAGKIGPRLHEHLNGAKCIDSVPPPGDTAMTPFCGDFRVGASPAGGLRETGNGITMERLAYSLSQQVDRLVVDGTKLNGVFDLEELEFTPYSVPVSEQTDSGAATSGPSEPPPSIFTAVQDQLGLKLVSSTGPVDVLVIDHVEEPSNNSVQAPAAQSPAAAQSAAAAPTGPPTFEAASVKPLAQAAPNPRFGFQPGGRFGSTVAVQYAISFAYNLPMNPSPRLKGGPDWIRSMDAAYDIEATGVFPAGLSDEARKDRERLMVQALLVDRFKLVIHRETKEIPVYALVVAKGGPKLQKADIEEKDCPDRSATPAPDPKTLCHALLGGRGRGFYARAVSISELANGFENYTDRPLVDKTGIQGLYHIETTPWRPVQAGPPPAPGAKAEDGTPVEDLPTTFEEFAKLGLKTEPRKAKVDVYVIDSVEKPSAN